MDINGVAQKQTRKHHGYKLEKVVRFWEVTPLAVLQWAPLQEESCTGLLDPMETLSSRL